MTRRILAGAFVLALMFTLSLSAEQIKEMQKTSPTPINTKPPANAVDINSATETDLVAIGIDKTVATKIVAGRPYRSKHELVTKQLLTEDQYDKVKDKIVARRTKKTKGGD